MSLYGPSRTIIVEPLKATPPAEEPSREAEPEPTPVPEREPEKVPA